ncbi:hypothetical protein BC833DRAFT_601343 [Globomyces pollinis-pini]|nr:hypothetical protein BC833DRAFT_601343 [Globomyces pollinis-pini]
MPNQRYPEQYPNYPQQQYYPDQQDPYRQQQQYPYNNDYRQNDGYYPDQYQPNGYPNPQYQPQPIHDQYIQPAQMSEAFTIPRNGPFDNPNPVYNQSGPVPQQPPASKLVANQEYVNAPMMEEAITLPRNATFSNQPRMPVEPVPMQMASVAKVSPLESNDIRRRSLKPQEPSPSANFEATDSYMNKSASNDKLVDGKEDLTYPQLTPEKPERNCMYCCIPTNRKRRNICLSITAVLLLIIGVLTFLFFPRIPDIQVNSINVAPGSSFKLTPVDLTQENINFSFEMGMIMNIGVFNPNSYHLKIDELDLNAFTLANSTFINEQIPSPAEGLFGRIDPNRIKVSNANRETPIGKGTFGTITFPPRTQTNFTMNFTVSYSPNQRLGALNDPGLNEIIQLCVQDPVISPTLNRTTIVKYIATTKIAVLSYIGYTPSLTNQLNINCPFQGKAKESFINGIKGSSQTGSQGTVPSSNAPPTGNKKFAVKNRKSKSEVVYLHLPISDNMFATP